MSAKDDLDRFEREWGNHLEWRKGKRNGIGHDKPGVYVDEGRHGGRALILSDLPDGVRVRFLEHSQAIIGAALERLYVERHRELRLRARAEALRTLEELPEESRPDPFSPEAIEGAKGLE